MKPHKHSYLFNTPAIDITPIGPQSWTVKCQVKYCRSRETLTYGPVNGWKIVDDDGAAYISEDVEATIDAAEGLQSEG